MTNKSHPIQPLVLDDKGTLRYKQNAIVRHCVSQVGLNTLAKMNFSDEDWNQLAQLIGYSHAGSPSYLNEETSAAAWAMHERGLSEAEALVEALREQLQDANERIGSAAATLLGQD